MWLNDRLDGLVTASLMFDRPGWSRDLLSVSGTLHHWRDDSGSAWAGHLRVDIEGLYLVGADGAIDLSELPVDARVVIGAHNEMRVELSEGVWLSVVEATEELS